jgi:predicted AAA+ superfamily ATPase
LDTTTRDVALALNPWLLDSRAWPAALRDRVPVDYRPRTLEVSVRRKWVGHDRAHLVVGPRQAGKSTLVWHHLAEVGPRVLFLTLEDARIRTWCSSAALVARDLAESFAPLDALFLDEVQHLQDAAVFVKTLVDLHPHCPVLVTGSSSFQLRSRTRESLAGRASRTLLLPFSLSEVTHGLAAPSVAAREVEVGRTLERHVRYGGYPGAWRSPTPDAVLDELVEAFLDRDASDFFRVRRPDVMRRLVGLAAAQAGCLVNVSEWASIVGASRDTVLEYAQILEDAHLVVLLPVFAGGRRAELTAARKSFFVDNGFRHAVLRDFRSPGDRVDAGPTWENWAFTELRKRVGPKDRLHYWRTRSGAEVDFVVDAGQSLYAIEVKAASMAEPRLSRSARSFIEAYRPAEFLVLNATLDRSDKIGSTVVRWVPFAVFGLRPMAWET